MPRAEAPPLPAPPERCPRTERIGLWVSGALGVTQKRWGPDGQRTCTGLQQESSVGGKSSPTKESLPSQNTTLISPVIIAQIDEDQSKGSHPSVPMQPLVPHPRACPSEPPVPSRGSAIVTRAFLVLPSGLEIQASLADAMAPSDSPSPAQGPKQQRGFASITVTARRVSVGSGDLARGPGAGQEPSTASPTSSKVPTVLGRWPPPAHPNQQCSPTKVPKSCSKLGEEPQKQQFEPGNEEDSVGLDSRDGRQKVSPSFTSRVQLQVSQRCPSAIYYLDKSLNVCLDQPRVKCQKMYRSTLSLRLKCSLSGLTADGVDGIANGEPMEERAPRRLPGARRAPLGSHLSADCAQKEAMNKEKSKEGYLGRKRPLQSVFASGLAACVDIPRGPHKAAAAAREEHEQPGSLHSVLSIQIPHPSTEAGTPVLVGSRRSSSTTASGSLPDAASGEAVAAAADGSSKRTDPSKDTSKPKEIQAQGVLKPKMSVSSSLCNIRASSRILREENVHRQKQLLKSDCEFRGSSDRAEELEAQDGRERGRRVALARVTLARVTLPRARPPGVAWERMALSWPESSSQLERTPAAPWTLREALELHNPQFISRSQKRLKRLQLMAQLRRAQQREAPPSTPAALARKLSSTSTASRKKQFTIPDPLSDNLFKPKERVIPEKEMHMRSKRIYDNLPEVKKKQEEKQKRIIIQSNRLRVEMFKKQLLDQLLHRNTE